MSFYEENILPHLINCACGIGSVEKQRQKVVPGATGKVLEIGMGSGLNLKHYDASHVDKVWGLEPSLGMRKKAQKNISKCDLEVEWLGLPSEQIPLDDKSADTIVLTYTLCTIPDGSAALGEMRRVLKPNGRLLFCEHGEAPDENIQRWQQRINPVWRRFAGGCNLNKKIPSLIRAAGFNIKEMGESYIPGPRVAAYNYWGTAVADQA